MRSSHAGSRRSSALCDDGRIDNSISSIINSHRICNCCTISAPTDCKRYGATSPRADFRLAALSELVAGLDGVFRSVAGAAGVAFVHFLLMREPSRDEGGGTRCAGGHVSSAGRKDSPSHRTGKARYDRGLEAQSDPSAQEPRYRRYGLYVICVCCANVRVVTLFLTHFCFAFCRGAEKLCERFVFDTGFYGSKYRQQESCRIFSRAL